MSKHYGGMRGLNGAPRPHLFTEEVRLAQAIERARTLYPHCASAFRGYLVGATGMPYADTETHWVLWRHEVNAMPLGQYLLLGLAA